MLLTILITVGFVVVAYFGYLLVDTVWLQRRRIQRRAGALVGGPGEPIASETTDPHQDSDQFPAIARVLTNRGLADRVMMMLTRAGSKLRPSEFIGIVAACAIGLGVLTTALTSSLVAVLFLMGVGIVIPIAVVKVMQGIRLETFKRQLPDALSLISSSVRSGYSFLTSIKVVTDEMSGPIAQEFQRVLSEVAVGVPIDVSLMRMSQRVQSYDFELLVTAVTIQQQLGGNLAEIIDNIAGTIRTRVAMEREMAALTADSRISSLILIALPIVIVVVILLIHPHFLLPLINDSVGRIILWSSIGLQIVGVIILRRMMDLDF